MIEQNLPVLIPVSFLFAALLIPLIGNWKQSSTYPLVFGAVGFAFFLSIYGLSRVLTDGAIHYQLGGWIPPIGIEYVLDPLSSFMVVVITGVALLVLVHSKSVVELELPEKLIPYYSIAMLFLAGLCGMVVTGDLFNLYVFLEISSLSGYALIAVGEKRSSVAAFRYLLLGTIGASFYLLGLGFLYIVTGSLNLADLAKILPHIYLEPTVIVGFVLMVGGVSIKMALFPLHGWLPDAYTLAPSASSALIAPIGTKVAAYVMIRIVLFVFEPNYFRDTLHVADIITWVSAAGILFGSIMAMAQDELKRMLAYSSVAQIGYIGLGLGMANPLALTGAVLHVLNHAFMKACLFLVAGNLRTKVGHSTISEFDDSLRKTMPWTMAAFSIAALSMIGIPPTAGFFSKWYLILGGIENSEWIFVAVILSSSLLNAVYFFRVLEKVYLRSKDTVDVHHAHNDHVKENQAVKRNEVGFSMLAPTIIFAIGIVLLGIFNAVLVNEVINLIIPAGI